MYYGILKRDQTIILVNIIGALLQILYIIMYFRYTKQRVSTVRPVIKRSPYLQLDL